MRLFCDKKFQVEFYYDVFVGSGIELELWLLYLCSMVLADSYHIDRA